jgi:hypothetical protein
LDAQRRAFLDAVEADLTTSRLPLPNADSGTAPTGRWKRLGVKGAIAGALLASASFLAFPTAPAQANPTVAQPRSVVIQDGDCYTPDMVQYDHTKVCPNPLTFMSYTYQYADHVHTNLWCFIFDATFFGCGGTSHVGTKTRCGYL